jgi:LPXTG-motif cell wall-anchored protein
MKNVTKKFVTMLLVLAMVLSSGITVFADDNGDDNGPATTGPAGYLPQRDLDTPVTLTIHHTVGLLPAGTNNYPGHWGSPLGPNYPTANREPVEGSVWRAARVEGPPLWDHQNEIYTLPNAPSTVLGAATVPPNVRASILAGWLGEPSPAGSHRRPVLASAGGAHITGWYVTSNNEGANATITSTQHGGHANDLTPVPGGLVTAAGTTQGDLQAIPGVLQLQTGADGRAAFTGPMTHVRDAVPGTPAVGETPAVPAIPVDRGHGTWLVWEVYVGWDSGDHDDVTEENDVIWPFLVNLPSFQQTPQDPAHTPSVTAPGEWIYNVHVFPKQVAPPDPGKDVDAGPGQVVIGNDPTATGAPEYTIIRWNINFGVVDDMAQYPLVPNANAPTGTVWPTTTDPVWVAAAADAEAGIVAGQNLRTRLLVADRLDPRLRLLPADYTPANNAPQNPAIPAMPTTGGHPDHWLYVAIYCSSFDMTDPIQAAAARADRTLIPMGSGATQNWALTVVTPTAAEVAADPELYQTFYVHFTQAGLQFMVDDLATRTTAAAEGVTPAPVVRINFRTIMDSTMAADRNDPITNNAYFNFGNRPTIDIYDREGPGGTPRVDFFEVIVDKVNNAGQPLNGAVFFLFRCEQMTGTPGSDARTRNLVTPAAGAGSYGARPYRVAISGGLAGNDAPTVNVPALADFLAIDTVNLTEADRALILAQPVNTAAEVATGTAIFGQLRPGTYYLYEVIAPGQYRRVEGFTRIVIAERPACVDLDCPYHGEDAEDNADIMDCTSFDNQPISVNRDFVNHRDFVLPMTGGAGTIMFTTAGVSLMGIAGLFLFLSRKKDKAKTVKTIQ